MRSWLTFLHPGALLPDGTRYLLRAVGRRFRDGRCAQVAGSLAFTTLLSLVPFVTLVAVVFSRLPQSQRLDAALRGFLLDNLLPEKAGKVIATYALQFSQKATNLTIAGALALILTTVLLMRTIDQVINEIWMVRSRRLWATRLAAYWVALSVGPLLLAGGVVLASAMLSVSLSVVGEPVWLEAVGLKLISMAFTTALFGLLYYVVPHCRVNAGHAVLAGFLAALGLMLMQRLLGLYLVHFPSYTLVYGAFAAVPILLVWLYLSWIVVLLGAVVAAVLPERKLFRGRLPDFPGRRLYVALLMLSELVEAQRHGQGCGFEVLARVSRAGQEEAGEVLARLASARLVACGENGDWLLARSAEGVRLAEVVRLFGLSLPPACEDSPDEAEREVRQRYQALLSGVERAADLPLASLRGAGVGAQRG